MTTTARRNSVAGDRIRRNFPALHSDTILLDNAGGSLVPTSVADAIRDFMLTDYVQLEAPYAHSQRATRMVDEAHDFINLFVNGERIGKVALGPSTTRLVMMLVDCYGQILSPGDEIVLCETAHEANAGPWLRLADRGITIRWWRIDPEAFTCSLDDLRNLMSDCTRVVAFPHVSNLLGDIVDVKAISKKAHQVGATVIVDGYHAGGIVPFSVADINPDYYMGGVLKWMCGGRLHSSVTG